MKYLFLPLLSLLLPFTDSAPDSTWVSIHMPEEVTADTNFTASIEADVHNGDTTHCSSFRIYLASHAGKERNPVFYHSDCYLLHEETLCKPSIQIKSDSVNYINTTFSVSIPANVGPSGRHYVLKARTLQTDGSYYGASLESWVFGLNGGTGEWGVMQQQGASLWGDDGIPCSSYHCVRDCGNRPPRGQNTQEVIPDYNECANACEGVYIDPSSSVGGMPTTDLTMPTSCAVEAVETSKTPRRTSDGQLFLPTGTRTSTQSAETPTGAAGPARVARSGHWVGVGALLFAVIP